MRKCVMSVSQQLGIATLVLLISGGVSDCKRKPKPTPSSKAKPQQSSKAGPAGCPQGKVAEVKRYLTALSAAKDKAVLPETTSWYNLKLAAGDRPLVRRPTGDPLVVLRPGKLIVNGQEDKTWTAHWKAKRSPPPAAKKPAPVMQPAPPKGAGMLGVLSKMADRNSRSFTLSGTREVGGQALARARLMNRHASRLRNVEWLYLAIEPSVPAEEIHQLCRTAAGAGYRGVHLLVKPIQGVLVPPPPAGVKYFRTAAGTSAEEAALGTAKLIEREMKKWAGCKPMVALYAALGDEAPALRGRVVLARMPKALQACQCSVDEKSLLAAWHMMLQPYDQVGVWKGSLDASTGKAVTVEDPTTPWHKIAPQVLARRENALFWILVPGAHAGSGAAPPRGFGIGAAPPSGARVFMSRANVSGGLDAATVRRVIRRHLSEVKYCYLSLGLASNPTLSGMVKVSFTITKTGAVGQVSIAGSTLAHPKTEACIMSAVRRWKFPAPEGTMPFVTYPFHFKAK